MHGTLDELSKVVPCISVVSNTGCPLLVCADGPVVVDHLVATTSAAKVLSLCVSEDLAILDQLAMNIYFE